MLQFEIQQVGKHVLDDLLMPNVDMKHAALGMLNLRNVRNAGPQSVFISWKIVESLLRSINKEK